MSLLLPRVRAYLTPLIEVLKILDHTKGNRLLKAPARLLDDEAVRSLTFLQQLFMLDPAVHVSKFLSIQSSSKIIGWSDASGFNTASTPPQVRAKNLTPGMLGSI